MKQTKLSPAPFRGRRCRLMPAPARSDAGTASQLIRGVRWTPGLRRAHERTEWMQCRHAEGPACGAGASRRRLRGGQAGAWSGDSAPRVRGMVGGASPSPVVQCVRAAASERGITQEPPNKRMKQTRRRWSWNVAWCSAGTRDCAVIVRVLASPGASQLIRGVRRTRKGDRARNPRAAGRRGCG